MAKEISKQPSNDSVVWLLTFTLTNMYNKEEQTKQGKIQNVQYEVKRVPESGIELNPLFMESKKKIMKILMLNIIKGGETSGKDTT